jgi:hypothetical protein
MATEARAVVVPYLGAGVHLRIIVGPATSLDGSVLEGFVYSDSGVPTCIFDHSDRTMR